MAWTRHPKGVRRAPGEMNRNETAYAQHLEVRRHAGEVIWFGFEPINLRLAQKTYYRPDFLVMLSDDTLEVHEVKGSKRTSDGVIPWMEEDARIKLKIAAEKFPFRFKVMFFDRSRGWLHQEIVP
jgi:hypothetical protein